MSNPLFCLFCLFNAVFKRPLRSRPLSLPRLKGRLDLWPFCHWRGLSQASYRREPRMKPLSCSQGPSLLCYWPPRYLWKGWFRKLQDSLQRICQYNYYVSLIFLATFPYIAVMLVENLTICWYKYFEFPDTWSICPVFQPITKLISQPTGSYLVPQRPWNSSWKVEPMSTQSLGCKTRFGEKKTSVGQVVFTTCMLAGTCAQDELCPV